MLSIGERKAEIGTLEKEVASHLIERNNRIMATIVIGISGSIAAYKAADLTSKLTKEGHSVHCVMTRSATEFITPLTLQTLSRNPVLVSLQDEKDSWKPGHIALADDADLMLIAPATANTIGLMANGLAPDPLTSIYLATKAPILIAPAMNGKMWKHDATQRNVAQLKEDGCSFIGPEEDGMLACGYEGAGRLWETSEIVSKALEILDGTTETARKS